MPSHTFESLGRLSRVTVWLTLGLCLGGCSTLPVPTLSVPKMPMALRGLTGMDSSSSAVDRYQYIGDGDGRATATMTQAAYQKVRQARAENAIVLQLIGDDVPLRVLPLPPATIGSANASPGIFVSTLLDQTGVADKLGAIEATLYRYSPNAINGIRMDVLFNDETIRPECDYALRPGDRLVVRRRSSDTLETLVDMALGR